MALTFLLLTCTVLVGLGLTVGLLSLLEVLFGSPAANSGRSDTRLRAAEALIQDPDSLLLRPEMLRNVSQSA